MAEDYISSELTLSSVDESISRSVLATEPTAFQLSLKMIYNGDVLVFTCPSVSTALTCFGKIEL